MPGPLPEQNGASARSRVTREQQKLPYVTLDFLHPGLNIGRLTVVASESGPIGPFRNPG